MFINLKTLKDNPGQEITLTLNSAGVFEKKEYNGKSWNNFKYEVIQDGSVYSLDATDSLHKKLNTLKPNSTFNLSWEEFTSNTGELRNYWKVDLFEEPQYENVKAPVKNGANPVKAVPQSTGTQMVVDVQRRQLSLVKVRNQQNALHNFQHTCPHCKSM